MVIENHEYPKVLVIGSNCFSTQKNNGKTFVSYFNGYPVDKIAQLYIWPEFPDSNICNNYYRITDMDMLRALIANGYNCGQKVEMRYSQEDVNVSPVFGKGFTQWHSARIARELIWLKKSWKTKTFINWVEELSPDVILFYGIGNPCLFRIADFLCKKYNLPIIVSITDDYYLPRISLSPFYHIRRLWLVQWMKKILHTNKSELITINQFMKEKYKEIFSKDSSIMMNCVPVPETCPQYNDNNKRPLKIAYIGSLSLNRWKTLKFLGDVLSSSIYKDGYVIEIYAREVPNSKILKAISNPPYISYCGSLDAEGVINKQKEADILLVAESFNYNCRKNTLLSLSTKITEYMSTGKAILAIGPPEIGSMRFLEENSKAVCITKLNKKAVADALELLLEGTYRIRAGESNWNYINQIIKTNDMGSTFIKLASQLCKGDYK